MPISAGSIPCPPYIQDQEQHRRAITQWMMRVSPFVTSAGASTFVTQDSLSAALAAFNVGTFVDATQFNVKADTRRFGTNLSVATATNTQIHVPSASFVAADIGKSITLAWTSGTYTTTIASVSSTTAIGLGTGVPVSLAATPSILTFGTDDASAMQVAMAYCQTAGAALHCGAGFYTFGKQLTASDNMAMYGDGWKAVRGQGTSTTADWQDSPAHGTVFFSNFMLSAGGSAMIRTAAHTFDIRNIEFECTQPLPSTVWTSNPTPWCIKAYRQSFLIQGGDHYYFDNLMLRNSNFGIRIQGCSRGHMNRIYGQCFAFGLYISGVYDVLRVENVHMGWPFYDGSTQVMSVMGVTSDAIILGKVDNPMLVNCFSFHCRSLLHIFNSFEVDITPNGFTERLQATNLGADDCQYGLLIQDNCTADITNFYSYCRSVSVGAGSSYGVYVVSSSGQAQPCMLNLTNVDVQGSSGEAFRVEVPTRLNISNIRLRSYNEANIGSSGIHLDRSSTCNLVNVIDFGNNNGTSLMEAVGNSVFNYAQDPHSVSGNAVIYGGLTVKDGFSVSGGAVINGATFVGSTLTVSSNAIVLGQLYVQNDITGKNGMSISGAIALSGNLSAGGTALFTGGITGKSGASLSGGVAMTGDCIVGGALSVSGAAVVTGGITSKAGISASGGVACTGAIVGGSTLSISSFAQVNGYLRTGEMVGSVPAAGYGLEMNHVGSASFLVSYNRDTSQYLAITIAAVRYNINVGALTNTTNDVLAAAAGVNVGDIYRNGSILMVRVA